MATQLPRGDGVSTTSVAEKMDAAAEHNEYEGVLHIDDARFLREFTEDQRKKVIRKIDVWLHGIQHLLSPSR